MKYTYLKNEIPTNAIWRLVIKKRLDPVDEKDFETKALTGRKQYPYVFLTEDNKEMSHFANEHQQRDLETFSINDTVQCVRKEMVKEGNKRIAFLTFTPVEGAEARSAATPQIRSNTAEVRQERSQAAQNASQNVKEYHITLTAVVKSMIEGGWSVEKTKQEAPDLVRFIFRESHTLANESTS